MLSGISFGHPPSDIKDYRNQFYLAKSYLARGETDKALPIYKDLYDVDTTNSNISYLLGVCYTEEKDPTDMSIYHLEKGASNISVEYDPGAHTELSAPIFAWYYLTIAYSQNNLCAKAMEAANHFKTLYGSHKNDFYTKDAMRWVSRCTSDLLSTALSLDDETVAIADRKVVTRKMKYATKTPLYAVQIGAFSRLVPIWKFDNLSNVDAFMDDDGMIRYVIGHLTYVSQANILLKAVWHAGYKDAFIVDINSTRKDDDVRYQDAIVSVDDISFKSKVSGKVDYRVQVGAFRESIPDELVQLYLTLEGLKENVYNGLTSLTVGSYYNYEEASAQKDELTHLGINGAFIVAYNYSRKIPVDEANHYRNNVVEEEKKPSRKERKLIKRRPKGE
ncbi:MAG: SPOR domain-containing protein [Flavobacteriales bacterium]|nr:SPOR domain-containing protein [Flavobacteriales bacterium]